MMLNALADAGGEVHYIAVEPYPISHPKIVPHLLWSPFSKKEGILFWAYFISTVPIFSFIIALRCKVDIVSVFGGLYAFLAAPLKFLRKPVITFARSDEHEINLLQRRSFLTMFWEDLFVGIGFKVSDRIITVSDFLKETLLRRYRIDLSGVSVLKNHVRAVSVDPLAREAGRRRFGFGSGDFVIVTVSVLNPEKNIDVLIRAVGGLDAPATLLIVGDGPERSRLEKLASQTEGPARILFLGWQNHVSEYLSSADLFVFPSKYEGCSNALLEALAHGVPCLASRIPQNREIFSSERLLFDPDGPEELTQKISQIVTDRRSLAEVNELSAQSVKPFVFDWDQAVVSLHEEVLGQGKDDVSAAALAR